MRDSGKFKAPAWYDLKAIADDIRHNIEIQDFEEAILNMTGLVALLEARHTVDHMTRLNWVLYLGCAQTALLTAIAVLLWRVT